VKVGRAVAGVVAAGVVAAAAACQSDTGRPGPLPIATQPTATQSTATTAVAPTTAAAAAGCAVPTYGPVEPGSVVVPGPNNGLPASPARGVPLTIVAVVLDASCAPARDATVHLWHTDAAGRYGTAAQECCYYDGTVRTDQNGRFLIDTIRPGQYDVSNAPPAHIHFELRHPSGSLETEIVFAATGPPVPLRPADVIPVVLTRAGGGWSGEVTFVLR